MENENNYSQINVSDKRNSIYDLLEENNKPTLLSKIEKIINIAFKIVVAIALVVFICYLIISFYTVETQIIKIGTNINNNINYIHDIIVEHNKSFVDLETKVDKLIIEIDHYLKKINETIHNK